MSIEENKAVVQRWHEEFFNGRNPGVIDEVFDDDYHHSNLNLHGPAAAKELFMSLLDDAPDLHLIIDDVIAEGDRVVTRWSWQQGGVITYTGITIHRVVGGKIVEDWSESRETAEA